MGIYTIYINIWGYIWYVCILIYGAIYNIIVLSREERRYTDGQKNRQADKSGSSTYTTCLRNRNAPRSNQNDYREYPIRTGEGNLPYLKNISKSICKINMIKNISKLVITIVWFLIVVIGLILLFI